MNLKEQINEALTARLMGDWTYNHKKFPRSDWRREVYEGNTQLGYCDWVIHNLES